MVESSTAITLAAILITGGFSLFTRVQDTDCNCTTLSSFLFLTAVFAWLSTQNVNRVVPCLLPTPVRFLYEFLVSLFVFDMALRLFWDPLECYLSNSLPALCSDLLDCGLASVLCSDLLFVSLVYLLAIGTLWSVLYGHGVVGKDL